jgi:hypothetical protein
MSQLSDIQRSLIPLLVEIAEEHRQEALKFMWNADRMCSKPMTTEDWEELFLEVNAWSTEQEAKRASMAAGATTAPVAEAVPEPAKPRNIEREVRAVRRQGKDYAEVVAAYIRGLPSVPNVPMPRVETQLQGVLALVSLGVTTPEHLARVMQINKRHASVLLSRVRRIRTNRTL